MTSSASNRSERPALIKGVRRRQHQVHRVPFLMLRRMESGLTPMGFFAIATSPETAPAHVRFSTLEIADASEWAECLNSEMVLSDADPIK
jgi:hypothetical protein